ncbi:DUF4350 domain-containing protein [Mucilaginibacter sp. 14171R-50]|uniref:DUF4350 domain-containing protein n=1 Tax=Mucilaginibacter sp. 14171R-50 TaxID=2703789 RepID=UPI00138C54BD|nr:DUF4350 domain-containing protein [Mucilaginibacter sp. 14171R-50]QHS54134.1 DUF4350 domain-containing protein [Mucilaginibacter sp. 14171R-50]
MKRSFFGVIISLYLVTGTVMAQTVTLDYFFNHETHQTKGGQTERFHYLWEDTANSGFSVWGDIFRSKGATLSRLDTAPTAANLKGTSVYIIVDPDSRKENPNPNYIQQADADNIARWVKAGGVLIMMANDSANVELNHFNLLAGKFGMHFNNDMQSHVIDDAHFEDGAVLINNNPVFKTSKKAFIKDACSIGLSGRAKPLLKAANGTAIAAITKYGKGTVIAIGDPWLYNEYVNGRLPAGFDNDKAAADLAVYVLSQCKLHPNRNMVN